ncbi:MAG TPA: hypothetical protein ENG03_01350 [Thioploca sp.]|nr:hypothetical protein [Thioploca sp.]
MWQKRAFIILLLLCGASLFMVSSLVYDYEHEKSQIEQAIKNQAKLEMQSAVEQIDEVLSKLLSIANDIADDISAGELQRSQIMQRLERTMGRTPYQFGIGVAYVPYVNDPQQRRQSRYYINKHGDGLTDAQNLLQLFTVPCFYTDPKTQSQIPKCVVFVDYSLNNIKALMTNLELGKTGYGFILSKQGVFINHPIEEYVKERKTIFKIAALNNDKTLKKLGEQAIKSQSGVIEHINKETGQSAWIFYQPIPATGWVMCAVFIKDDLFNQTTFRQKQIEISLWFIVFCVFLSALLFRVYKGEPYRFWMLASSISMLLLVSLGFVGYFTQTAPLFPAGSKRIIIVDKAGLHKFLSVNAKHRFFSEETPQYVPTGIVIESAEFSGENEVILTGYIWQKYDDDVHQKIARDFILKSIKMTGAEQPKENQTDIKMTSVERHKENQTEVIRWYFESTVHQLQFDYSKYPFDKMEINLMIRHKDVNRNVILIPDLEAYQKINPNTRPGIKPEVVLPGWHIKRSFFNYHFQSDNNVGERNFPHLYFTVFLQRDFLNPFIANVLPVIVVGIMLFAILLLLGRVGTFANVVAPLTALFFGLLLAHIGLNKGVPTSSEHLYVEYYYWVMYTALFGVVASHFLYHRKKSLLLVQYRNGLVLKLLFWPFILVSILGITVWTFYN